MFVLFRKKILGVALLFWGLLVLPARAYFVVVIQEKGGGYALRGEVVRWLIFRGEPFQGLIRDLRAPKAFIVSPTGEKSRIPLPVISLKDLSSGKLRRGFHPRYVPTERGDHYLYLISEEDFVPGTGEVWKEFTKVPLHVEEETDWKRPVGLKVEIVPLTRPYGLESGAVFAGKVLLEGKPLKDILVQVTRYYGMFLPQEALPKDDQGKVDRPRMYLSVRTDEEGRFVVALNQPGWWLISARIPHGYTILAQQRFPLILRASFWLYVKKPFKLEQTFPRIGPRSP